MVVALAAVAAVIVAGSVYTLFKATLRVTKPPADLTIQQQTLTFDVAPYQTISGYIWQYITIDQYSDKVNYTFTVTASGLYDYTFELDIIGGPTILLTPETPSTSVVLEKSSATKGTESAEWFSIDLEYTLVAENVTEASVTVTVEVTPIPP